MVFWNNPEIVFMNNPEMLFIANPEMLFTTNPEMLFANKLEMVFMNINTQSNKYLRQCTNKFIFISLILLQCADYPLWYDPNAERGAKFYCLPTDMDFGGVPTTEVNLPQSKKIVPLNFCIFLRFIIII